MSKKWNPFRKKGSKADSHGTTSANEELFFQPASAVEQDSYWHGSSGPNRIRDPLSDELQDLALKKNHPLKHAVAVLPPLSTHQLPDSDMTNSAGMRNRLPSNHENGDARLRKDSVSRVLNPHDGGKPFLQLTTNSDLPPTESAIKKQYVVESDHPHVVAAATITRTSPRAPKKLIKPGETYALQPAYLQQTGNSNESGFSVSDEYTDPYDSVIEKMAVTKSSRSAVDGYIEPFEAQKMYHGVTHGGRENGEIHATKMDAHLNKDLYDEPWDNTKQPAHAGHGSDYEEPWDNTAAVATLPYVVNKAGYLDGSGDHASEYHMHGNYHESGDSSASSSSASLAKQKMVRVDSPRHSPQPSPHISPKLDRRLIKPKDVSLYTAAPTSNDPRFQLYSAPGGGRYRPVDQRLIKAEPSVDELRKKSPNGTRESSRTSSRTNSPLGSNRESPNRSPISTLLNNGVGHLHDDAVRRASSPFVQQPINPSHYLLSKAKSRSLDIRNRQYMPSSKQSKTAIPKSVSDDQLTQATVFHKAKYRENQPLGGVSEYEEPWDGSGGHAHRVAPAMAHVSHVRSRSYELHSSYNFPGMLQPRHGKSHSFDKPDVWQNTRTRLADCEQPWDQPEVVPKGHLVSMQRFQHRQLELHPSEAIGDQDCDPLLPLERQSWFHGSITREEANRRLLREREGSYLVRNSESIPNNYSLSVRMRMETIHMVISKTRDGLWILGEFSAPFHSVPEMVAYYANHRLKINDAEHISLRYPAPDEYL